MLSSVQIQGLRPVVRMTKELQGEIVEKAANDSTWQELYNKGKENGAIEGDTLADITYKDVMLLRKCKGGGCGNPRLDEGLGRRVVDVGDG